MKKNTTYFICLLLYSCTARLHATKAAPETRTREICHPYETRKKHLAPRLIELLHAATTLDVKQTFYCTCCDTCYKHMVDYKRHSVTMATNGLLALYYDLYTTSSGKELTYKKATIIDVRAFNRQYHQKSRFVTVRYR